MNALKICTLFVSLLLYNVGVTGGSSTWGRSKSIFLSIFNFLLVCFAFYREEPLAAIRNIFGIKNIVPNPSQSYCILKISKKHTITFVKL